MTTLHLAPLPFHRAVVAELQRLEPELWRWFSSAQASTQHEDEVRQELLKSTYRLDAAAHPEAYAAVDRAKEALALSAIVTLYQAQGADELNAGVLPLADEAHIVFSGPTQTLLTADELVAVLAHELAHFALWHLDERAYFVAERMLTAFANDPRAHVAHLAADRRFALATEVFADRAGLVATGDIAVAVASLVKMTTGLPAVDAPSYLRQADEVFAKGPIGPQGVTHPEPFVRARALRLWSEQGAAADAEAEALTTGPLELDALDLVQQARVSELTAKSAGDANSPPCRHNDLWASRPIFSKQIRRETRAASARRQRIPILDLAAFGAAGGLRLPHPEGDQPGDHRHQEHLAEQCFDCHQRLRQPGCRGQVAEPERGQHDEAEVQVLRLLVRAGLGEEIDAEAGKGDAEEREHEPGQHVRAERTQDRLVGDHPVLQRALQRDRQVDRDQHRREQVGGADQVARVGEQDERRQEPPCDDRGRLPACQLAAGARVVDRSAESDRSDQRGDERADPLVVDQFEHEEVREQQPEQRRVRVEQPNKVAAGRASGHQQAFASRLPC